MLILSRMVGEKIMIGDDITVMIVDVDRTRVRLGIEAPKGVSVHREEVYLQIKGAERADDNQAEAGSDQGPDVQP